jgi:hypothetical protein
MIFEFAAERVRAAVEAARGLAFTFTLTARARTISPAILIWLIPLNGCRLFRSGCRCLIRPQASQAPTIFVQ